VGRAAAQVLHHNGVDVVCPPQNCCGMPALDGGDTPLALTQMAENVRGFAPALAEGRQVVSLGPTCGYMFKREYPHLEQSEGARALAGQTLDVCEFLMKLHVAKQLDTNFTGPGPGKVAYHLPCHLKAQHIGYKSRDLLALLPGAEVEMVDKCSAMDGTWGMKVENYELSCKVAGKMCRGIKEASPDRVVTDCLIAGIQIAQGTGWTPVHPVQLVARAYGLPD
jgi:Fe-S oxidoreductase